MSTRTFAQGGPRPIECLPCTLQPNAVLAAAPLPSRALSLAGSGLAYGALASVLLLAARERIHVTIPAGRIHEVVFEQIPAAVSAALPLPPRAAGNGMRPPDAPVTERPAVQNQVPEYTPQTLSREDHSRDGQFTEDMPVSKEGTGRVVELRPSAAPAVLPAAKALVQLEFQAMRVVSQVQPSYPALARSARIQGPVSLLMTVDAHGVPIEVQVLSGPHPSLEQEAARVARQWRFEPARVDGEPVSAQFRLTVVFRLGA